MEPVPIGVTPRWLWLEQHPTPNWVDFVVRRERVSAAIARYKTAGVPPEWAWHYEVVLLAEQIRNTRMPNSRMVRLRSWLGHWARRVVARLHLDSAVACAMSAGDRDYHDYHDTEHGTPDHFVSLACARCGKEFWL